MQNTVMVFCIIEEQVKRVCGYTGNTFEHYKVIVASCLPKVTVNNNGR